MLIPRLRGLMGLGLVLLAGTASALTADGVLITNLAWGTYRTTSNPVAQNITYGATANVLVATPMIQLRKTTSATIQVAGGIVTFCLSYSNTSSLTSALNVVVADKMPDNMKFTDPGGGAIFDNDPPGGTMTPAYSFNNTAWTTGVPTSGQAGPLYLRWTTDVVGPKESAYMCYTVSIL
jgi:uncharacterized repeat protein (TIGR01451 family)